MFAKLEDIDKETTQQSVFLRGVAYLRSIQVPLERFKLALDLVSPLANLNPIASTVIGIVRSVTAVSTTIIHDNEYHQSDYRQLAISFATADMEFAKQICETMEQISYIDDCDTLGQSVNKINIYKVMHIIS